MPRGSFRRFRARSQPRSHTLYGDVFVVEHLTKPGPGSPGSPSRIALTAQLRVKAANGVAQGARGRPPAGGDRGQIAQLTREPPGEVLAPNTGAQAPDTSAPVGG